jgi:hypothetical protein
LPQFSGLILTIDQLTTDRIFKIITAPSPHACETVSAQQMRGGARRRPAGLIWSVTPNCDDEPMDGPPEFLGEPGGVYVNQVRIVYRSVENQLDATPRATVVLIADAGMADRPAGRSLVNMYGGFFSICLRHAGLAGFGNGLTYSESREWPALASTGAAPPRYYVRQLHAFLPPGPDWMVRGHSFAQEPARAPKSPS